MTAHSTEKKAHDDSADKMSMMELGKGGMISIAPARRNIITSVCIFILLTELCERITYYGITGSMKIFLTNHLGFQNTKASQMTTTMSALVYVTPFIGGYIADTMWGRFKAILVFASIYMIGIVFIIISAVPSIYSAPLFLIGVFVFVVIGAGGIKSNVVTFGADQFDVSKPKELKQQEAFFNYFYWSINLGAAFSYGYLSQLSIGQWSGVIPADYGFFAAFAICFWAFAIALLLFVGMSGRYTHVPAAGSAVSTFFASFRKSARASPTGRWAFTALYLLPLGWLCNLIGAFLPEESDVYTSGGFIMSIIGMILIITGCGIIFMTMIDPEWVYTTSDSRVDMLGNNNNNNTGVVGVAASASNSRKNAPTRKSSNTRAVSFSRAGSFATDQAVGAMAMATEHMHTHAATGATDTGGSGSDGVIITESSKVYELLRLIPVLLYAVVFFTVYNQMTANFVSQACQMNVFWNGRDGSQINGAFLNCGDAFAIIIFIPFFDKVVYPIIERVKGSPFTPLQKFVTGLFCSGLAMVVAILIEYKRRAAPLLLDASTGLPAKALCSPKESQPMSDVSVWIMLIPFFLVGMAECLISVPMFDLCYNEVPEALRSTAQAMNLFTMALGGSIATAITGLLAFSIKNNLNDSHIEYQYYVLAVMSFMSVPAFMYTTRNFKYKADTAAAAAENGNVGTGFRVSTRVSI